MTKLILKISITIFIQDSPLPPAPTAAKKPKPVFTKKQSPVCRCKVRYENRAA